MDSGEAKNAKYAMEVVHECNEAWTKLITKAIPSKAEKYDIQVVNTSVASSPYNVTEDSDAYKAIPAESRKPAAPVDPSSEICSLLLSVVLYINAEFFCQLTSGSSSLDNPICKRFGSPVKIVED